MVTIPEDVRYFEQYRVISRTVPQTPANGHARWPEGSGAQSSGSNPVDPLIAIGSSSRKRRKRSLSTESAERRGHLVDSVKDQYAEADDGVIDFDAGSHAAQLKRQSNAQATKRSRTRLKTMKEEFDEEKKARKTAEEREKKERELRLKAEEKARVIEERARVTEAENKILKQKLENKR
ncbi:hypothetical protein E4U13_000207 [Claviceps humidiphila]|uniref:Uncharacterized protein n=1 Tax=Claviceps humidiphila TaxID=1294629 RepID=A0A9P7PTA3_9HYPO|nr:hypothetical protein E4U13_000207 [Claviceps humidiphila]